MDSIVGGRIATNGVVKLTIDSNKVGYIFLPNHTVLTTVARVIETTYTGVGGRITYYVSKNNQLTSVSNSELAGNIKASVSGTFYAVGCPLLTGVVADNAANLNLTNSVLLSSLVAPRAATIFAQGCRLDAKSIGDILYAAYIENKPDVMYYFSGGTNANEEGINDYLFDTYAVPLATVIALLDVTGTITLNPTL